MRKLIAELCRSIKTHKHREFMQQRIPSGFILASIVILRRFFLHRPDPAKMLSYLPSSGSGIFLPATFEKRMVTVFSRDHRKNIGLNGRKFLASSLDISKSRWILKMPSPLYGPNGMWKFPTSNVVFKGVFNIRGKGLLIWSRFFHDLGVLAF